MRAQFRVYLVGMVTGQEIANAVQQIANRNVKELVFAGDAGNAYLIGQNSYFPANDLEIKVGSPDATMGIFMEHSYTDVCVVSCQFPGMKCAGCNSDEEIAQAVREFRDKLQPILNQFAKLRLQDTP